MSWRKLSGARASKGSQSAKVVSLGDLHRRRQESQGQFFTAEWISRGIWEAFSTVKRRDTDSLITAFDSGVGSGALFEGADTKETMFYGVDIDADCIGTLCQDAKAADLMFDFRCAGMESIDVHGFDLALINPAYSLHIESPSLFPYECTSFGRFGPATAAVSHEYALEQALDAAHFVAAVLPITMDETCRKNDRLQHVVVLPANAFKAENANVRAAVYLFGRRKSLQVTETRINRGDAWPRLTGSMVGACSKPRFRVKGVDLSQACITLPVTGNQRVELHHHNRRIVLHYSCGLIQAKVANGLLRRRARGKRLPGSIWYTGDGALLLDVLLLQEDPHDAFDRLLRSIELLGGEPWVSPSLQGYFRKLVNRHKRAIMPMHRAVFRPDADTLTIQARRRTLLNPNDFNSATVAKDTLLQCRIDDGEYVITHNGDTVRLRQDEVAKRFHFIDDAGQGGSWVVKHLGLEAAFPEIGKQHRAQLRKYGIDKWLAGFAIDSVVEGLISPYGYIGGWEQGSGKSRASIALALLHSGRSMLVLNAGLIPEMLIELKEKIGLDEKYWRVLNKGDKITTKLSIVSYGSLRNNPEWRRQINLLICDEGGVLSNINTQQTRGVRQLAARKLIVMDGTVVSNYPRDVLPLSVAAAGNGVAHQCYGVLSKPMVEARMLRSADEVQRGEDAFFERHIVTRWVTNEFREDLQSGSKREIPLIDNLPLFRRWLAPNIQRRLRSEPALAEFNNCPEPISVTHTVDWDSDHLGHYLTVATEFANWYRKAKQSSGKSLNLVTLLARIGAVRRAANSPHVESVSAMRTHWQITSKQRAVIKAAKRCAAEGRKFILYADSPDVLERLHGLLQSEGVSTVLYTGRQSPVKRNKTLHDEFRLGSAHGLLSSWCGQRGLNLEMAEEVLFYERSWSATVEEQAIYRTQRPAQTAEVVVRYFHLEGSIDEYCAQMVEWKSRAAAAGLDFGEQIDDESEFLHLDTLLSRFCNDIFDMSAHEVKRAIAG